MAPVILVTFAGRRERMEILTHYIRRALELGIIDQWHVWDFTRSKVDRAWVTSEFGPARYMNSLVPYMPKGHLSRQSPFRMDAVIGNDLHIGVQPRRNANEFYEIVVGGWDNLQSAVRKLPASLMGSFLRPAECEIWTRFTPGALSSAGPNSVVLKIDASGVPVLHVNNVLIGRWPEMEIGAEATISVRGGFGADLEIVDVDAPVRRYIGEPDEQYPYYRAYEYYAKRAKEFEDAVFLKCDDDIVYMDLAKLGDFISFRRENPNYLITSANVINNQVCAHFQQASGAIPADFGHIEMPPNGYGGNLWQSAERANALHELFLNSASKHLALPTQVVETKERVSINFISWLGKDLKHLAIRRLSDEKALTIELPAFLDRPIAIYSDFTVSHLSFGPQERGLDVARLVSAYGALMQQKLAG